jgi:hypothetical protein
VTFFEVVTLAASFATLVGLGIAIWRLVRVERATAAAEQAVERLAASDSRVAVTIAVEAIKSARAAAQAAQYVAIGPSVSSARHNLIKARAALKLRPLDDTKFQTAMRELSDTEKLANRATVHTPSVDDQLTLKDALVSCDQTVGECYALAEQKDAQNASR